MPAPGSGPQYTPATDKRGRVTRYRVELPRAGIVETEAGHFEATEFAEQRSGWQGRLLAAKDRLIGTTVSTANLQDERLRNVVAFPVHASNALSSSAYATQELMLVLVIAGSGALVHSLPIALLVFALLGLVALSYSQLIRAYPDGGGTYAVALENLGRGAAVLAAGALLIEYALMVAVALSAGVAALASAAPALRGVEAPLAAGLIALIALANLRGLRESSPVFAIVVYGFILLLGGAIVAGVFQVVTSDAPNLLDAGEPRRPVEQTGSVLLWFLLLRAFSTGSVALTGVETIPSGTRTLREPQTRNAVVIVALVVAVLGFLFVGTTLLARHFGLVVLSADDETLLSQLGKEVFGTNALYYALQVFTAGILLVAANSAFAGFPRLTALLASDGFLPRIFYQRGNRLVYSYGIAALAASSILLVFAFGASTTKLIPLYAIGVFLCFTLAQAGLFRRLGRLRPAGWRRTAVLTGFGAAVTALVTIIMVVTRFTAGGWMVVAALPLITYGLWRIGGFYEGLRRALHVAPEAQFDLEAMGESRIPIIVPVEEVNLAAVMTLGAACERSREVTAVHVRVNQGDGAGFESRWHHQFPSIPLVVIDSPFRTVADPIARYVDDALKRPPHEVTVMVPLLEVRRWYHRPLVNQSLKRLTSLLRDRRHVNLVPYPFFAGGAAGRRRKIKKGLYIGTG